MNFGEKIREICKREGINLREFSELADIPYGTIRNYSSGKTTAGWPQIYKIADVPRFEKYRLFIVNPSMTSPDDPFSEQPISDDPMVELLRDVINSGHRHEAEEYLRYLKSKPSKE